MSAEGTNIDMASKFRLPPGGLRSLNTAVSNGLMTGGAKGRPDLPKSKSHQERKMATSASGSENGSVNGSGTASPKVEHDWLVILPDRDGTLSKRMEVRPTHLKEVMSNMDTGFWRVGGATLEEPFQEGQPPKINGSCMIARASSKEEVIEELKKDIYTTAGIWDWEKVQIWPFKAAFYKGD